MSLESLQQYVLARELHLINTSMSEHEQHDKRLTEIILSEQTSCENNKWASVSHLLLNTNNNVLETLKSVLLQRLTQAQDAQHKCLNDSNLNDNNGVWTTTAISSSKSELFSIVQEIVRFCEFDNSCSVNNDDDTNRAENNVNKEENKEEEIEQDHEQRKESSIEIENENNTLTQEASIITTSQSHVFYLPPPYVNKTLHNMNNSNSTLHRQVSLPSTHKVFIRMLHSHQLNEESLNTYFGRYGQVTVQLLSRQRLTDWVQTINDNMSSKLYYTRESSSTSIQLDKDIIRCVLDAYAALFESISVHELWMQDFIITLDSALNVQLALSKAYYKELLFIALHNDTAYNQEDDGVGNSEINCYTVDELNVVLLSTLPVVKMQSHNTDSNLLDIDKNRSSKLEHMKRKSHKRKSKSGLGVLKIKRHKGVTSENEEEEEINKSDEEYSEEDEEEEEEESEDEVDGFVPDIVIDNFPYWTTEDQIKIFLQEFGTITHLHLSVDDLSGIFTGAVMVGMQSLQEAVELTKRVHMHHYMNEAVLRAGILTPELKLEDVLSGEVLWSAQIYDEKATNTQKEDDNNKDYSDLVADKQTQRYTNEQAMPKLCVNERLWVEKASIYVQITNFDIKSKGFFSVTNMFNFANTHAIS